MAMHKICKLLGDSRLQVITELILVSDFVENDNMDFLIITFDVKL